MPTEEVLQEIQEKVPRKTRCQGVRNKVKGSNAEREYAIIFREMGCDKCKTTRNSSKLLDDCKVDLNFIPLAVQVKAGIQQSLNPTRVLKEMKENLEKHFPDYDPIHTYPKLIIHHKDVPKGQQRRTEYESMVTMTFETFKMFFEPYFNQFKNDLQNTKRKD